MTGGGGTRRQPLYEPHSCNIRTDHLKNFLLLPTVDVNKDGRHVSTSSRHQGSSQAVHLYIQSTGSASKTTSARIMTT